MERPAFRSIRQTAGSSSTDKSPDSDCKRSSANGLPDMGNAAGWEAPCEFAVAAAPDRVDTVSLASPAAASAQEPASDVVRPAVDKWPARVAGQDVLVDSTVGQLTTRQISTHRKSLWHRLLLPQLVE